MKVSDELKKEWFIRELIRAVQEKRKELGLKVTNKIILYVPDDKVFKSFARQIEDETGCKLALGEIKGSLGEFEFEGKKHMFGVKQ